jgi:hypothetical protein
LNDLGGGHLLHSKYNSSLPLLLAEIYPEYDWLPWKFSVCPHNYWDNKENQRKFMDWAGKQMNVNDMSDWYNVTRKDLCSIGGRSLLMKYNNSRLRLLSEIYPKYDWNAEKFGYQESVGATGKKSQFTLKTILEELFPKEGKYLAYISLN